MNSPAKKAAVMYQQLLHKAALISKRGSFYSSSDCPFLSNPISTTRRMYQFLTSQLRSNGWTRGVEIRKLKGQDELQRMQQSDNSNC